MVSQRRRSAVPTRDRLIAAAAEAFARRGYDGATVDAIAARARINKAMVYYHFHDKAALYRAILVDVFQSVARAVAVAPRAGDPDDQLRAFIRALAGSTASRPHFPSMWLREIADGGRHLDASVVAEMAKVLATLGAILEAGRVAGRFRPAHPLITQMGIIAPLLMFSATADARARFARALPGDVALSDRTHLVAHLESTTLAALRPDPSSTVVRPGGKSQ